METIFQSGKSRGIFITLEKSGNFTQNTGKNEEVLTLEKSGKFVSPKKWEPWYQDINNYICCKWEKDGDHFTNVYYFKQFGDDECDLVDSGYWKRKLRLKSDIEKQRRKEEKKAKEDEKRKMKEEVSTILWYYWEKKQEIRRICFTAVSSDPSAKLRSSYGYNLYINNCSFRVTAAT